MGDLPDRPTGTGESPAESGGDPACWAHLLCPECGAVEHTGHRAGCPLDEGQSEA